MHDKLIAVQRARKEHFAAMANANFYARFINSGRLRTVRIGARRYTTNEWIRQCISEIVEDAS